MSTENCTKKNKWSNWSLETLNPRMAVFQPRWLTWKTWYRLTHFITEFLAIKFLPTFIWEELVVRHIYLDAGYACMFCHTFILDTSHLNLHCSRATAAIFYKPAGQQHKRVTDWLSFTTRPGTLGLKRKQWAADIIGCSHFGYHWHMSEVSCWPPLRSTSVSRCQWVKCERSETCRVPVMRVFLNQDNASLKVVGSNPGTSKDFSYGISFLSNCYILFYSTWFIGYPGRLFFRFKILCSFYRFQKSLQSTSSI